MSSVSDGPDESENEARKPVQPRPPPGRIVPTLVNPGSSNPSRTSSPVASTLGSQQPTGATTAQVPSPKRKQDEQSPSNGSDNNGTKKSQTKKSSSSPSSPAVSDDFLEERLAGLKAIQTAFTVLRDHDHEKKRAKIILPNKFTLKASRRSINTAISDKEEIPGLVEALLAATTRAIGNISREQYAAVFPIFEAWPSSPTPWLEFLRSVHEGLKTGEWKEKIKKDSAVWVELHGDATRTAMSSTITKMIKAHKKILYGNKTKESRSDDAVPKKFIAWIDLEGEHGALHITKQHIIAVEALIRARDKRAVRVGGGTGLAATQDLYIQESEHALQDPMLLLRTIASNACGTDSVPDDEAVNEVFQSGFLGAFDLIALDTDAIYPVDNSAASFKDRPRQPSIATSMRTTDEFEIQPEFLIEKLSATILTEIRDTIKMHVQQLNKDIITQDKQVVEDQYQMCKARETVAVFGIYDEPPNITVENRVGLIIRGISESNRTQIKSAMEECTADTSASDVRAALQKLKLTPGTMEMLFQGVTDDDATTTTTIDSSPSLGKMRHVVAVGEDRVDTLLEQNLLEMYPIRKIIVADLPMCSEDVEVRESGVSGVFGAFVLTVTGPRDGGDSTSRNISLEKDTTMSGALRRAFDFKSSAEHTSSSPVFRPLTPLQAFDVIQNWIPPTKEERLKNPKETQTMWKIMAHIVRYISGALDIDNVLGILQIFDHKHGFNGWLAKGRHVHNIVLLRTLLTVVESSELDKILNNFQSTEELDTVASWKTSPVLVYRRDGPAQNQFTSNAVRKKEQQIQEKMREHMLSILQDERDATRKTASEKGDDDDDDGEQFIEPTTENDNLNLDEINKGTILDDIEDMPKATDAREKFHTLAKEVFDEVMFQMYESDQAITAQLKRSKIDLTKSEHDPDNKHGFWLRHEPMIAELVFTDNGAEARGPGKTLAAPPPASTLSTTMMRDQRRTPMMINMLVTSFRVMNTKIVHTTNNAGKESSKTVLNANGTKNIDFLLNQKAKYVDKDFLLDESIDFSPYARAVFVAEWYLRIGVRDNLYNLDAISKVLSTQRSRHASASEKVTLDSLVELRPDKRIIELPNKVWTRIKKEKVFEFDESVWKRLITKEVPVPSREERPITKKELSREDDADEKEYEFTEKDWTTLMDWVAIDLRLKKKEVMIEPDDPDQTEQPPKIDRIIIAIPTAYENESTDDE
jgi:hypothetical protein